MGLPLGLEFGFNCRSQRYLCQNVKGKAKRLRRRERYDSFVLAHNLSFGLPLVCGREHFIVTIDVEKKYIDLRSYATMYGFILFLSLLLPMLFLADCVTQ